MTWSQKASGQDVRTLIIPLLDLNLVVITPYYVPHLVNSILWFPRYLEKTRVRVFFMKHLKLQEFSVLSVRVLVIFPVAALIRLCSSRGKRIWMKKIIVMIRYMNPISFLCFLFSASSLKAFFFLALILLFVVPHQIWYQSLGFNCSYN